MRKIFVLIFLSILAYSNEFKLENRNEISSLNEQIKVEVISDNCVSPHCGYVTWWTALKVRTNKDTSIFITKCLADFLTSESENEIQNELAQGDSLIVNRENEKIEDGIIVSCLEANEHEKYDVKLIKIDSLIR